MKLIITLYILFIPITQSDYVFRNRIAVAVEFSLGYNNSASQYFTVSSATKLIAYIFAWIIMMMTMMKGKACQLN